MYAWGGTVLRASAHHPGVGGAAMGMEQSPEQGSLSGKELKHEPPILGADCEISTGATASL